ncbi:hypothetical protein ES703_80913 [subsurface metagenome]
MNEIPQARTLDAVDDIWCVLYQQGFIEWIPLANWLLERSWEKLPEKLKEEIRAICGDNL